jgi:N-acetyl-gamma-glutamyl-phosphate reductase
MESVRVGVVGATGYSGAIAARLIATHPNFELAFCTSDQRAGEPVTRWLGVPTPKGLTYAPNAEAAALAPTVDAVILATSAEVSAKLAPPAFEANRVVIDLSGAFRLHAEDYPKWYGFTHPRPDLLPRAHYGLPELFGVPTLARGEGLLVANPGCYATAAMLAIAPLVRAGLIAPRGIIVDGKSGVSGAGRRATEEYSFVEIAEDVRAYRLLAHQHTPEIALGVARASSRAAGEVASHPHQARHPGHVLRRAAK